MRYWIFKDVYGRPYRQSPRGTPSKGLLAALMLVGILCISAVTQINLTSQVQGILPVANGGTNAATFTSHYFFGNNTGSTAAPAAEAIGTSDVSTNWYAVGAGSAQAQTVTLTPAATALTAGLQVAYKPGFANTGGGPTLAVNGLTATAITKCGTTGLVASDLTTTAVAYVLYDGTQFQLENPQATPCGNLLSGTFADNETPTGTCPTTGLTLAYTPNPAASLSLYYNGQLLVAGGADYTLAAAAVTLTNSCPTGTVFRANYRR